MGCAASAAVVRLEHRLAQSDERIAQLERAMAAHTQPQATREEAKDDESRQEQTTGTAGWMNPASGGVGGSLLQAPPKPLHIPAVTTLPTDAEIQSRTFDFDVFLSHKRTDTADFARTLQTELSTVGGLTCFLDQDADFELGDLMAKVRQSRCLVFILSEHILESEWCLLELREALAWKVNVVLLTAHGARWMVNGAIHDFPPTAIIPPVVQPAFANKAVEYNRNFHKPSVDQLYTRIFGRPPRVAMVDWDIPATTGEKPESFALDLATIDLELPPSAPLQILQGLHKLSSRSGNDQLVFFMKQPFHVANDPPPPLAPRKVEFVPPPIDVSKPLHLFATATTPWAWEPTRDIPAVSWSALVVDAPPQSVQTGLAICEEGLRMESHIEGRWSEYDLSYVQFPLGPFPTRPEVFLCLEKWESHGSGGETRRRVSLLAKHVDTKGFTIEIAACGPNLLRFEPLVYEIDLLRVRYLAFEPRLNRSWVHGEVWVVNEENHRRDVTVPIHFASDCAPSAGARTRFVEPPQVFVALSGLDTDVKGFDFAVRVSDITISGCSITWSMYHHHTVASKQVFAHMTNKPAAAASGGDSSASDFPDVFKKAKSPLGVAEKRPPSAMAIRWIALPTGAAPSGALTSPAHHSNGVK